MFGGDKILVVELAVGFLLGDHPPSVFGIRPINSHDRSERVGDEPLAEPPHLSEISSAEE